MAQKRNPATRKRGGGGGKYRLSANALTDHSRYRGSSRRGLFWRPGKQGGRCMLLPNIRERGPRSVELPYYAIASHFVDIADDSERGSHPEGKTCWEFMKTDQPAHTNRLLSQSEYSEADMRCLFCEVLEKFEDSDSLPLGQYGVKFARRISFNMDVIQPEGDYEDDEHLVKIYPASVTVIDAVMHHYERRYPDLFNPSQGYWLDIELDRNRYNVHVVQEDRCWIEDWESGLHDLEEVSPNFWTYEEQTEYFEETWPHLLGDGPPPKKTEASQRKKAAGRVRPSKKKVSRRKR